MDLDSRVNARVVANVDGWTEVQTDVRTDGKPDPYIVPCLRQGRQKIQLNTALCKDIHINANFYDKI